MLLSITEMMVNKEGIDITANGPTLNVLDPVDLWPDVRLPEVPRGVFFVIAHSGNGGGLVVKDAAGMLLCSLSPRMVVNFYKLSRGWIWQGAGFSSGQPGIVYAPPDIAPEAHALHGDGIFRRFAINVGEGLISEVRGGNPQAIAVDPEVLEKVDLARLPQSHDNLQGLRVEEHISHTAVKIEAGTGLEGGGDLTASRRIGLSIKNCEPGVPFDDDWILFEQDGLPMKIRVGALRRLFNAE